MKGLLQNKILLVVLGLVVVAGVILVSTGALKFSASVSKPESKTVQETKKTGETQQQLLSRAVTFKGSKVAVTMSIKLPLGWATGSNDKVDFVAGSQTADKLENGQAFTPNIIVSVGKHASEITSFSDVEKNWKAGIMEQYPSMEAVTDFSKKLGGLDVYVMEVKNIRPDGAVVHQIQYVYYLDDTYIAVVTGSVPEAAWSKYRGVITSSMESLERVAE